MSGDSLDFFEHGNHEILKYRLDIRTNPKYDYTNDRPVLKVLEEIIDIKRNPRLYYPRE